MLLFKRGKYWWARQVIDGKDFRWSTKCTAREEAAEVAQKMLAPLLLRRQAGMMMDTARRVARNILDEADRMEAAGVPLADAFAKYPRERRDGLPKAPSTIKNAEIAWRQFVAWMNAHGKECLGDVTEKDARKYLDTLGPRWRQVAYHILKNTYEGHNFPHPFGRKPARRQGEVQHREPLTPEQIRVLLDTAKNAVEKGRLSKEYPLFLRFLLYTGLRVGDAATARTDQVDFDKGILERTMAKTGRSVTIPLHPSLLDTLPRTGRYLFPDLQKIYSHGMKGISHRISIFFREAGITGPRQAYCAHSLRTTFASLCAEQNVPIAVIQSWLGHTSQEVTRIYARVESLRAKREALSKLPDF